MEPSIHPSTCAVDRLHFFPRRQCAPRQYPKPRAFDSLHVPWKAKLPGRAMAARGHHASHISGSPTSSTQEERLPSAGVLVNVVDEALHAGDPVDGTRASIHAEFPHQEPKNRYRILERDAGVHRCGLQIERTAQRLPCNLGTVVRRLRQAEFAEGHGAPVLFDGRNLTARRIECQGSFTVRSTRVSCSTRSTCRQSSTLGTSLLPAADHPRAYRADCARLRGRRLPWHRTAGALQQVR